MGYYYGFDPTYILVIIGAVICMLASSNVNNTYRKYAKIRSRSGMTGAEAAARILAMSGIHDVSIQHISGDLTDHYDPSKKVLRLSDAVYDSHSVAAIGVAAHECGHAIQDNVGYAPLRLRSAFVPIANLGSKISLPLIILGFFIGLTPFIEIGIWMFVLAVLFQIITLPVEFNASSRAVQLVDSLGILRGDEGDGIRKVLGAAALTYVAAAAASILQLARLIILFGGRRRND